MKNYDENIIRAKNLYKSQTHGNILEGIIMREKDIKFEKHKIFGEKIQVYLPKSFIDMPQNIRELKYPMNSRPQIIKMNAVGDVNMCFNLLKQEVKQEELKCFTEQMRKIIRKVQTAAVMYDVFYVNEAGEYGSIPRQATEHIEGRRNMSIFDYKLPAIDEPIYYYMAFMPIGNELFQAIFSCCYREIENWKVIFEQIVDEIRVYEGG